MQETGAVFEDGKYESEKRAAAEDKAATALAAAAATDSASAASMAGKLAGSAAGVDKTTSAVKKMKASGCSITWVKLAPLSSSSSSSSTSTIHQVTNNGFKQGITQKMKGSQKAQSFVCRRQLLKRFLRLVKRLPRNRLPEELREILEEGRRSRGGGGGGGGGDDDYDGAVAVGGDGGSGFNELVGISGERDGYRVVDKLNSGERSPPPTPPPLGESSPTYRQLKLGAARYQEAKAVFLSHPPFSDWLVSPVELQNFSLPWSNV